MGDVGDRPRVREYRITTPGRKQLEEELTEYRRMARGIDTLLDNI